MDLGRNIFEYRKAAGKTQQQVADDVGVAAQNVSQWEHNEYAPDIYKLMDLAKSLNTTVGRLLEENRLPKERKRNRLFNEERMYTYAKTAATERKLYQTAKALPYARKKHEGAFRKGEQKNVPYIIHPLTMVCEALSMQIYDDDILSALLLHDVVEDTDTPLEDLPVSSEAKELVRLMTKDPHPKDKTAAKKAYYEELSNPCWLLSYHMYSLLETYKRLL